MREFTKSEKRQIKDIIQTGILRRHAEWLQEVKTLIEKQYNGENEFDRSMEVTQRSRDFYKEAMSLENYYRNTQMFLGMVYLMADGYLCETDLEILPDDIRQTVINLAQRHRKIYDQD